MELLGDTGQVEAHFSSFRCRVNLGAREVHGLGLTYHRLGNHFGQMMELKWKLVSVSFEIVLILTKDRCTVCVECAIGLEIILGALDGTSR
jgi:hypothetical protein